MDRDQTFRAFSELFVEQYFGELSSGQKQEIVQVIKVSDEDGYRKKSEMFEELRTVLPWRDKPDLNELMEFYGRYYVESAVLMEGAIELLEHCKKKGYKLGLITNGLNKIQYGKINKLHLQDYFEQIVVSEEAGVKKPDERIFRWTLERLEVTPEQTVFVGDHPINDIAGAAKIGMKTIWLKRNQPWDEKIEEKPMMIIVELEQLLEFFRKF